MTLFHPSGLTMKKPEKKNALGRGLGELLGESQPAAQSDPVPKTSSQAIPGASLNQEATSADTKAGISRLLEGGQQKAISPASRVALQPDLENQKSQGPEMTPGLMGRLIPNQVFYLGDLVLMSFALWYVLRPVGSDFGPSWGIALTLALLGAGLAVIPWIRRERMQASIESLSKLPRWNLITQSEAEGVSRHFVMHLQHPPVAIEMRSTSWGEIQPRPIWLAGLPDISPEQLQNLLLHARRFFEDQMNQSVKGTKGRVNAA